MTADKQKETGSYESRQVRDDCWGRCGKIRSVSEQERGRQPPNRGDIRTKISRREKNANCAELKFSHKVKHTFLGSCTEIMTVCSLHIVWHDSVPINYIVVTKFSSWKGVKRWTFNKKQKKYKNLWPSSATLELATAAEFKGTASNFRRRSVFTLLYPMSLRGHSRKTQTSERASRKPAEL